MLGDTADYYYGPLVPSAGYLKVFGLEPYHDGMLLRVPDWNNPTVLAEKVDMPKTYEMFREKTKWDIIMRLSNAGDVNKAILKGHASELIQVSEALQEKKIVQIAEDIERRFHAEEKPIRLVLITGPSSSGKTTFCKRLSIQLLACGLRPMSFSTDDYFVNRVDTPKLPNGDYDFDNIETVDYALLEDHLSRLMKGERVEVPEYNFTTGKREWNGKKLKLAGDTVLIIEGIHALNPKLTQNIEDSLKYRIYISALTSISLDDHNWIPVRDNRLLRRIIRDYNKGAYTARETIAQWKNVCEAEDKWIFPYQETADAMFNSALNIEFAVLRTHAEIILSSVQRNCPEYAEAHRLLKRLAIQERKGVLRRLTRERCHLCCNRKGTIRRDKGVVCVHATEVLAQVARLGNQLATQGLEPLVTEPLRKAHNRRRRGERLGSDALSRNGCHFVPLIDEPTCYSPLTAREH